VDVERLRELLLVHLFVGVLVEEVRGKDADGHLVNRHEEEELGEIDTAISISVCNVQYFLDCSAVVVQVLLDLIFRLHITVVVRSQSP